MTISEDILSALRPGTLETLAEEAEAQGKLPGMLLQEVLDRHMPRVRLKQGADGRRYPRRDSGLEASVFLDDLDNLIQGNKVSIKDISMSGLRFGFTRDTAPGLTLMSMHSEIAIQFFLPNDEEPVLFHGRVCHVYQVGDEFNVGVRFSAEDFDGYSKLFKHFGVES